MRATDRLGHMLAATPRAFSRAEIIETFSRHTLDQALERGLALRFAAGVYIAASHASSLRVRTSAAALWGGDQCAVGGVAAIAAHGVEGLAVRSITLVTSRHNRRRTPAGVRLWRTSVPQRTAVVGGVRVVHPADAVIQAWFDLPTAERIGTTLDAMRVLALDGAGVAARLSAYPRIRGRRGLEQLLTIASSGVTSYLEYVARTRVFRGADFDGLEWQARLLVGRRRLTVDAVHGATRVIAEFDGRAYHGSDFDRRRDVERDALLAARGFVVLRFTYEDIVGRPRWCRTQLKSAIAARAQAQRRGGQWVPVQPRERHQRPASPTGHLRRGR